MSNHRLPGKSRRMGPIMGHTMHYRRMIVTLHQVAFHQWRGLSFFLVANFRQNM
uniref:Pentatricopeptide repeat-containing protein n=1 Tax=Solanum tuberosum TaxID=4113 RepID=M1BGM4_SOLTU